MLKQKTILITGASSGIGKACALEFAKCGANLILCGRREKRLLDLSDALKRDFSIQCHLLAFDIRDYDSTTKALESLPANFKTIDVLINNAGLALGLDKVQDANINDWEQMIDTNIKGLFYLTRLIIPNMLAANHGHVINISSMAAHGVYPSGAVYCATKHAVDAFSRGLRLDVMGSNIRVTAISPGMVETEFSLVRFNQDAIKANKTYSGIKPLTPEDVANSVIFATQQPLHVNINEIILTPLAQAGISHVHRGLK